MPLQVLPIASQMSDNYFYLLSSGDQLMLVDPVDASTATEAVRERGGELCAVLNTHWHPDHVAGNAEVLSAFPGTPLIAPAAEAEKIQQLGGAPITRRIKDGDEIELGEQRLKVIAVPGHTHGHVAFLAGEHLLSGDVIFSGGAGHCRSGDVGALFETFERVLHTLPPSTRLYMGHDYAESNLKFALSIMPQDAPTLEQLERAAQHERPDLLVTTLEDEARFNLFMRAHQPQVQRAVSAHSERVWQACERASSSRKEATFRTLRALRDEW